MSRQTAERLAAVVLAVPAWATLVACLFLTLPMPVDVLAMAVALTSTTWLVTTRYQRPLGDAYELGYHTGRRDAIREANGRGPDGGRLAELGERLLG